jgi:thiol-disulfide isomerase/thioredoxin
MGGSIRRIGCAAALPGALLLGISGEQLYGANSAGGDPFAALGVTRMTAAAAPAAFDLKALDGASLRSEALAGKVVLLNFWATWCGPCKEEMPSLARLQSQFDPGQVRVITVTTDLYPQGIKHFLDHLGITLPVLFDEDQELSRRFMVRGLPTTVLIGQDGQTIGRAVGPRSWDSRDSVALVRHILDHQP